ncbi:MAG: RluA family pseudouridine synthase [Hyphomicrobiales bacterium]
MTNLTSNSRSLNVSEEQTGERLDRLLSLAFDDISRSRFKDLVKQGQAAVNGRTIVEPNYRVKPGDEIIVSVPPAEDPVPKPENIPLAIVYEDNELIVIDKAPGMVVHPAAGNWHGTLVNALIAHCGDSLSGIGGVRRPGIVHRLDKETSGLMAVAKTDRAHKSLSEQFAAHGRDGKLTRAYECLVWGVPDRRKGKIDAPLGRKQTNRQKIAVSERGRHAVTHFEVLETMPSGAAKPQTSHMSCVLETGRTHQIRVHLAHIGHPLLGDEQYGAHFAASARKLGEGAQKALTRLKRQALHAVHLGFEHPLTGEPMRFDSPLRQDMQKLLDACRAG